MKQGSNRKNLRFICVAKGYRLSAINLDQEACLVFKSFTSYLVLFSFTQSLELLLFFTDSLRYCSISFKFRGVNSELRLASRTGCATNSRFILPLNRSTIPSSSADPSRFILNSPAYSIERRNMPTKRRSHSSVRSDNQ